MSQAFRSRHSTRALWLVAPIVAAALGAGCVAGVSPGTITGKGGGVGTNAGAK